MYGDSAEMANQNRIFCCVVQVEIRTMNLLTEGAKNRSQFREWDGFIRVSWW